MHRLLSILAATAAFTACTSTRDDAAVRASGASASDELFVAIAAETNSIRFAVAAPAQATGVILCPESAVASCRQGLGAFVTTDASAAAAGDRPRLYLANVSIPGKAGLEIGIVAHDARGAVVASRVVRLEPR
jgi:hypothetical protein